MDETDITLVASDDRVTRRERRLAVLGHPRAHPDTAVAVLSDLTGHQLAGGPATRTAKGAESVGGREQRILRPASSARSNG